MNDPKRRWEDRETEFFVVKIKVDSVSATLFFLILKEFYKKNFAC